MPKQTFFNLPDEKKNRIIECAIDEFSDFDFNTASINRIVENSKIAKGSFYQYFDDKLDLFKYVMEYISLKKIEYFSDALTLPQNVNFFKFLRDIFNMGIKFALENPKYSAIGDKLFKNDDLRKIILGEMEEKSFMYMKILLEQGQSAGDIREDINIDLAAHLLVYLNFSLGDIYYKANSKWSNDELFQKLTNDVVDILENGIKK